MKKLLAPVALALLAAVYLGLTYFTANKFIHQLQEAEAIYQQQPNITLKQNRVNSGFFASSGELILEIELDNDLLLTISSPWQAKHLPGLVKYTSQVEVELNDGVEILNLNQLFGLPNFAITGTGGFNKFSYQHSLPVLTAQLDDLDLEIKNWLVKGEVYYSGKDQGTVSFSDLKASSGQEEFNLKNLNLNYNQQGKFPWQTAKFNLALQGLNLTDKQDSYNLANGELNLNYQLNEQDFTLDYLINLKQFENADIQLDAAKLNTQLKLSGKPVARILEALKEQTSQGQASQISEEEIKQHFYSLLAASPKLEVKELSYNLAKPMPMNPSATGWLEFNGNNLPEDFLALIELGIIDEAELMNRVQIELKLKNLPSLLLGLMSMQGIALDPNAQEHLIKLEKGQVTINGELLN